jgi:hypothetical protein
LEYRGYRPLPGERQSERRPSDRWESFVAREQFLLNVQAPANCQEGLTLTLFGALPVADMQSRGMVVASG